MKKALPYIIIASVLLVIGVIAFFLFKKKKDPFEDETDEENLTLTEAQFSIMVDSIYSAVSGWNDDQEVVETQLKKLKTSDDWFHLNALYNIKDSDYSLVERIERDFANVYVENFKKIINTIQPGLW
ncbi:MAG: hypothetical protein JXR68_13040 [Bacteroidales bacterium]|nr:hypothetical protein [Bacteroidales bacterium]